MAYSFTTLHSFIHSILQLVTENLLCVGSELATGGIKIIKYSTHEELMGKMKESREVERQLEYICKRLYKYRQVQVTLVAHRRD